MRKKFLIVTSLSVGTAITAVAAIACEPIDQPIRQDIAENKLKKIVMDLSNKGFSVRDRDDLEIVKAKFEAITSDYKNKLLNLISKTEIKRFTDLLDQAEITNVKVTNWREDDISLKLSLSYTENGVTAANDVNIHIWYFELKDNEILERFLISELKKFTDRELKADSSNKQLLSPKSDINSLESWNNNTVGEAVSIRKDITVTVTKTTSDTTEGSAFFRITLEKSYLKKEKIIKVNGFKIKVLNADEKAIETTVNNFTLEKATLDRGNIYFPRRSRWIDDGYYDQPNPPVKSGIDDFTRDPEKWALVSSNSHLRAGAFKPSILDNKKFEESQYFEKETYKYLQARIKEKAEIKLEEGVTGEVKVVKADDINGEVIVSITFVKGEARSEEHQLTIDNFLEKWELIDIASEVYNTSLKKWNEQDKITKPAFTNKQAANKYIETLQKIFDDKTTYANDVKLKLEVDLTKGGIDYKNQKIYLLGTYSIGDLVLETTEVVLEGFNDKPSEESNLVLTAYNDFNKFNYQVREPKETEKVDAKWVASLQDIDTIEKLNDKLPEDQKISWTNQDKGVEVEVKIIDFSNKDGSLTLELFFKKGDIKSEPIKINLSGFLTEKQVLDNAVEVFKHALDKDKNGENKYEERMKNFVLYLKSNARDTLDDQGLLQMVAYQSYVSNLLNYGDGPASIKGLSKLANGATIVFKDGGLSGEWEFTVHYGGLISEVFKLNIPHPKTQNI
ncbi:lipoprotein 17-related variable surface protein [Mycoplasmopsis agassizii]|uniref:Lipoprotein-associated type-17 domain-containing protein n=1 Tax=Mycoplasmopsis agassizii TaxID=33922 RepID=A0ABX4H4D8_9BACT|nr:lipoprotein 17-related variable surface protein [Mycoplasmopsis agassizii]PAF54753.1 hypothetical protein CJF60_03380 [Mycoplasmopsis agassizii]SMC19508.1 Lipoprotein associated domain-containing protein [Mycoplasmopsis agassizii]